MNPLTRRHFLRTTATAGYGALLLNPVHAAELNKPQVESLFPRNRIPVSFIIDDSTCLVNMGHYCMPQFATAWPERESYRKPWKSWPREIPDSFVRSFGEWCAVHGVRGKYSIVPYPACVGWLDRELPGWSRRELQASLKLVRELMLPHWDIHPEMITHTRVIDLKSGRPLEEISAATMENSFPQEAKSVDEMAAYLAYALQIVKNCDLPCEGVTTPGGFGNRVKSELSLAVQQSVRDVYAVEIPHYFKYIRSVSEGTEPIIEHASAVNTDRPQFTVNVPAGTGDWFGGWDGDLKPDPDRYCNRDGTSGRMVELIRAGQPAVFLCHWPGMYSHGTEAGFRAFQQVVLAVNEHYGDQTIWMKPSEMARYWAAKKFTRITRMGREVEMQAPFACPDFTLRIHELTLGEPLLIDAEGNVSRLEASSDIRRLSSGRSLVQDNAMICCFDLPRGTSKLVFS